VAEERETTGRCGWAALALVLILFSGILPGSLFGGLTGMQIAELFGLDHAYELGTRLFILAGMITGLLVSTLIIMSVTIAFMNFVTRFRQSRCPVHQHSFRQD
jgi:hypothetical protein